MLPTPPLIERSVNNGSKRPLVQHFCHKIGKGWRSRWLAVKGGGQRCVKLIAIVATGVSQKNLQKKCGRDFGGVVP
jgi:hypothetical protein